MIKGKKGNILTENIIFIILNIVFFAILMVFVFSKTGSTAILEEKYSKQIALMIDSSEPGMTISMNMQDAIDTAKKNNIPPSEAIKITGNLVAINLQQNGNGYSYSFFNDVNVIANYDSTNKMEVFVITRK